MSWSVWGGLVVSLASSLVACLSKLKYPKAVRSWSRTFVLRNAATLALAALAVLGFVTAAFGVMQSAARAVAAKQVLEADNRVLRSLLLVGRTVSPTFIFVFETGVRDSSDGRADEEELWEQAGAPARLPKPIGFLSARVRGSLFPGANPGPLLRYLGGIEIPIQPPVRAWVRDDGSVIV